MGQKVLKKYRKSIRQAVNMEKRRVNEEFLIRIYAFKFFTRLKIAMKIIFRAYNKTALKPTMQKVTPTNPTGGPK